LLDKKNNFSFNKTKKDFKQEKYSYVLSFGSNLGSRKKNLDKALSLLKDIVTIKNQTRILETKPLKSKKYCTKDHKDYLNFLCEVTSSFDPPTLYENIVKIEDLIGHNRIRKWAPRKIDIDILLMASGEEKKFHQRQWLKFEDDNLSIPHYDLANRKFLLSLLNELFYP
tara:strand:+ start:149 stop:655 length:507 start_codon:yes stop_codon:yes gene_type:complete